MNRCTKIHHALNRAINDLLRSHALRGGQLVDIGCWDGSTTMTYAETMETKTIIGIEGMDEPAAKARARGITVINANVETDVLKIAEAATDTVVCNQVMEHLKDIFHPTDEIARILKPGGLFVISVPNLASFHNRLFLAAGMQPSSIRIFGPHVRGFSHRAFLAFLQTGGVFEIAAVRGVGFYPFSPEFGGNLIGNFWKSACHTAVVALRRTNNRDFSFKRYYTSQGLQTLM